ncbi:TM163 protein, partial [Polypterus senegalus]
MTDSSAPDLLTAPDPVILDPSARNGQCAPPEHSHPAKRGSPGDHLNMDLDHEMKISESVQFSDGVENRGLLESSTRLKPHEAQSYRKKALWVSWASIVVTLVLAVAAFEKERSYTIPHAFMLTPIRPSDMKRHLAVLFHKLVKQSNYCQGVGELLKVRFGNLRLSIAHSLSRDADLATCDSSNTGKEC